MRLRFLALLLLVMLLTACRGRPFAATDSLTPAGVVVVATLTPVVTTSTPVSYTHLDVYKRQSLHS